MPQVSSDLETTLLVWVGALASLGLGACAIALWLLLGQVRELVQRSAALARLETLEAAVQRLASERGDLDLRRIEHVLCDLRDSHKRAESALLQSLEARAVATGEAAEVSTPANVDSLGERITNRLHAMGYEQIWIATPLEQWPAALASGEAVVAIEARRAGSVHKGRVLLRNGRIGAVELNSPYALFP